MFKVDLHTHSVASPDGSLTAAQYHRILSSGKLNAVAITDHNRIDFAADLHRKMGEVIIVGEEIMTNAGEIIGLYLEKLVKPYQSPLATVRAIKDQGGLVYIPHPFETVRKGLSAKALEDIADYIDIIEVCNGRAFFQNRADRAVVWARTANKLGAASSDAHGIRGLGTTYTSVQGQPTRDTLLALLANGVQMTGRPKVRALLYPKLNKLRKKAGRAKA